MEAPGSVTEELGLSAPCCGREEARRPEPPGRGTQSPRRVGLKCSGGRLGMAPGAISVLCPRKRRSVAWAPVPALGHHTATWCSWQHFKARLGQGPQSRHQLVYLYLYFFLSFPCCLQHCCSHFPDGVLKARHKKSPNSSELLQTTKL